MESLLVLSISALMFLSPLMAERFFGQPYEKGLLLIRQNLGWFSFFLFAAFMRDFEEVDRMLWKLTFLFGIYLLILLATKFDPGLGIIHYDERFYKKGSTLMRFGEHRLFFPYGDIPVFLYSICLGRLLHKDPEMSAWRKFMAMGFVLLTAYAILSTYTRILVFSTLVATAFAFYRSKRPILKWVSLVIVCLLVSVQTIAMLSGGTLGILEETKLGKMAIKSGELRPEAGREFQVKMYVTNFLKSPLFGVGNIATRKDTYWENGTLTTYRKYGFFNGSDMGYMKIIAESGILGVIWMIAFFVYFWRRCRRMQAAAVARGDASSEAIASGLGYFMVYLLMSGVTLAHFVQPSAIGVVSLALATLAVAGSSPREVPATVSQPFSSRSIVPLRGLVV
ncbi:MAG: O-antigen ligase family protein [Candidatus Deferrimicrobium sp.]